MKASVMTVSLSKRWDNEIGDRPIRMKPGSCDRLKLFHAHRRKFLPYHELSIDDIDDSVAGVDTGDTADTRQRECAFIDKFRFSVLGNVLGYDEDLLGSVHQIHCASDSRHAFAAD